MAQCITEFARLLLVGSSFDGWLREEGIYEEVAATAIKRVLARQVEAAMKEKNFTKAEMARRMHTSRAALNRLLDPDYDAVTLRLYPTSANSFFTESGISFLLDLRIRTQAFQLPQELSALARNLEVDRRARWSGCQ